MSNINLLPWREQRQAMQKKQFLWLVGVVCLCTLMVLASAHVYLLQQVQGQQARNTQLAQANNQLNSALLTIEQAKVQRRQLVEKKTFVEQLQRHRLRAVWLFNQLPTWIPDNIVIEGIQLSEQGLEIKGQASAYSQLAQMVQRIEHSHWLSTPRLQAINNHHAEQVASNQFLLHLQLVMPSPVLPLSEEETQKVLSASALVNNKEGSL